MDNFSLEVFFKPVFKFFLVGIKEEHGSDPRLLVYLDEELLRQCHYTLHLH